MFRDARATKINPSVTDFDPIPEGFTCLLLRMIVGMDDSFVEKRMIQSWASCRYGTVVSSNVPLRGTEALRLT
jgi:hypothetical protein